MALNNEDCRDGKTMGGAAVSTYDIFDGEGYCKVVNKTASNIEFRLYGRAHSYDSSANIISITMYLFARKTNGGESYNNDVYNTITFTCGGQTATYKASTKGITLNYNDVRLLGYKEVSGISLATGSKTFKAEWNGLSGTTVGGPHTISETMYWNKNNADGVTTSIAISDKGRYFK